MRERGKNRIFWLVLALAVGGAGWYVNEEKKGGEEDIWKSGKTGEEVEDGKVDELIGALTTARVTEGKFEVLRDCQLMTHRNNDGDSFYVSHDGREYEFRLYFVDTPESKFKTYRGGDDNGERIREQGRYFAGLSQQETTRLGTMAKEFVLPLLGRKKFTVVTQWENVYGPQRKYAFVMLRLEGKDVWLHELLVARGMARIHTKPFTLPDGTTASRQRRKLKALEADAKAARRGGWGL